MTQSNIQEKNKTVIKNMLFWLHQVCLKHNLRYVADSGTLIGAVRHQGLIPWDGDADVHMPIDDWLKLHKLVTGIEDPFFINPDGSWTSERTPISGSLNPGHPQKGIIKKFNIPNDLFFQSAATDYHMAGRIIKIRSKELYNTPASGGPSHAGVQLDIFPVTIQNNHFLVNYENSPSGAYQWKHIDEIFPLVTLPFEDREVFCAKNHRSRLKDAYGSEVPPLPPPENQRAHEGPVADVKSHPLNYYVKHFPHLYNEDMSLKDATISGNPESVEEFLLKNTLKAESPDTYVPQNTQPRKGTDPFWKLFSSHGNTTGKEFVQDPPPEL
jgi:hypothetical protein